MVEKDSNKRFLLSLTAFKRFYEHHRKININTFWGDKRTKGNSGEKFPPTYNISAEKDINAKHLDHNVILDTCI